MTLENLANFQDAGSHPDPHHFAPPPNWVTLEIPRGFFVSISKLSSTPMEDGVSSGSAYNSGGYPGVSHQCERAASQPDARTIPIVTNLRRKVLCTLPPTDVDAAATTHDHTVHEVGGFFHRTKEQTKTRVTIP